ncbi:hypothetical protein [Variovorax sp. JS1663]|uniref:hypothetical protein n=1 Tax=Variovorax sp. JS1663 TaxID=1851577 RepID=UPI000B3431FE|nr:hypothetical protein [Variovorax sp. JS1663]OUM02971.1 hypothetical protein A8M77_08500 [Variovorax sp. JS1663]
MTTVPDDFPRDPFPGGVPGAQQKYLARKIDGRFVVGLTDEELAHRFKVCSDYLPLLVSYANRKLAEPGFTQEAVLSHIRSGVARKNEGFTPLEIEWLVNRIDQALGQSQ